MFSKELQELINAKFDDAVLLEIVKKKTKWVSVNIKKIELGTFSLKGDSYLSSITRFTIEATGRCCGSEEEHHIHIPVITKAVPNNVARRKTFRSLDFFENEITFYEKVWPAFHDFQQSKNLDNNFDEIPLLLAFLSDGVNSFIALEDLSFEGFQPMKRDVGLDFHHTQMLLRIFARFHALSFAYKDQHSKEFDEIANSIKETYFGEKFRTWYEGFQKEIIVVNRDAVEKQLPCEYLKKFDELVGNDFFGMLAKLCVVKSPITVITHGDAWIPNFLMKYDCADTPLKAKMIDFQLSRCASAAQDITFVLYACTDKSLHEHWNALIEGYYNTFVAFAKDLGSDASSIKIDVLKDEIHKHAVFSLGMCLEVFAMSLLDDSDVADIDAIEGTEAVPIETVWIVRPFKSEKKRQRIADTIKHAVDNGFF